MVLSALAYRRTAEKDPDLTTEFALVVAVLLGALTMQNPVLAARSSVIITKLLTTWERLHHLLESLVSAKEAEDGLIFLTATLVILPLAPNRALGPPIERFQPEKNLEPGGFDDNRWRHKSHRLAALGSRLGLALSGLAGGIHFCNCHYRLAE